jgi:hypothetical protein
VIGKVAKMGYPTKIQVIKRKNSEQYYVSLPSAVAQAMDFEQSEVVEWIIEDRSQLVLRRTVETPSALKNKRQKASLDTSKKSGPNLARPSSKSARSKEPKPSR